MTERFRPHHILCERFLSLDFVERGKKFAESKQRVIEIVGAHDDTLVEAIEGVDEICRVCPNCRGYRCTSPDGGEEAVRKWDSIILRSLGIGWGETMTAKRWRTLVDDKAPLDLCRSKCPHRSKCTMGQAGRGAEPSGVEEIEDVVGLQCTPGGCEEIGKKYAPLRDQAYASIKNAIITAELKPNQRIGEEAVAARIGTSRTPVREALQKLEIEGLILKKQGGGFVVKGVVEEEIEDIVGLQCTLESYAGRLAMMRIKEEELCDLDHFIELQEECVTNLDAETFIHLDGEFHARIHRAAKNARLYELVQSLQDILDRYRAIIFRSHASLHQSVKDHKEMIALMRARNARKIEKLISRHMIRGKNIMKKNLNL